MRLPCIDTQLVRERDGKPASDAAAVFAKPEVDTLRALNPTLAGRMPRQQNPHPIGRFAWAAWIIARLGGWTCSGKPPGPITMRRGREQFHAIHQGRELEIRPQQDVCIPWWPHSLKMVEAFV